MRKRLFTHVFMMLCFTVIFTIRDGGLAMNAVDNSGSSEGKDVLEKYATELRSEKFTLYSADSSWSDTQLESDSITFHKAKAVIPSKQGEFILKGETIIYSKKDECLLAEKASLTKPDGTMYTTPGKIKIQLAQPLNYKIY